MTDDNSTAATDAAASIPQPPPLLFPNLPDDIALQCIARVPLSHHPSLSLVSKSCLSTLRSPLLYTTRSLLNCTQTFLYLNIRINSTFNWYLLDLNPKNPRTTLSLSTLPPIPSPHPIEPAFSVLGPKIYVIGGSINLNPSNSIWVFDCRFNKWELGPRMRVSREFAAAEAVNGKIYVIGGCVVDNMNWAEVFDPVEGSWGAVPSPIEVRDELMQVSAVISDRIYRGGVVYDAVKGEWGEVSTMLHMGWTGRGAVVVDGVLYCYDYFGGIKGYDVEEDEWKVLKGVGRSLPKFLSEARMANVGGGRLCVVWKGEGSGKEKKIMCAEIEVWKDEGGVLSGSVVWSDVILAVPNNSAILGCGAVGL